MTSSAPVPPCPPLRMLADASWCAWLSAHLLLYFALDLGTLAVLAATQIDGGRGVAGEVLVAVSWGLPLHLGALLLAAGALAVLRGLADLRRIPFRLTALGIFVLPASVLGLLLSGGAVTTLLGVLPMHILMGLLVLQPHRRWADADPATGPGGSARW